MPADDQSVDVTLLIRALDTRQAARNHELHGRIHIGGNDGLIGVARGPDSEQFIHEPLADIGNPGEVHLNGVEVAFQPVQEPLRFASRYESCADLKQFDHWPRPDKGMVTAEFEEDTR